MYQRLVNLGSRIEGISRHASVHAAGVVIAPGPLDDYVPVCTAPTRGAGQTADGEDAIITQYDMVALEKVGMLKMDMLGLKTLTVIHDAVKMIRDRHGEAPDMATLSLDDPEVYAMLRKGRTAGVFQFESPLATETLRSMRCDRFDDLVAANALLRPGPLDAGMHTVFIRRKLGQEAVSYPHPDLKEVLEPTYGVITYQEQVMRIANVLAGFSLAEADVLRKAVGKKDPELIRQQLGEFIERAVALDHNRRVIEEIAAQIETFGRYGFNKSHSVAYSVLGYQTGVAQGAPPGRVHGGPAELGNRQYRQGGAVHQRSPGTGPRGAAAQRERIRVQVHRRGRTADPVRPRRGAKRRLRGHRIHHPGAARGALRPPPRFRPAGGPAALQQAGPGIADRRGCLRRPRRPPGPAHRGAGCGPGRGPAAPAGAGLGAGLPVRRGPARGPARRQTALPESPTGRKPSGWRGRKRCIGFFISGHPLERFRQEVELFGTRTTATLGEWSEHQVSIAAVVTAVRRQISKKTGKEYARLVLEDFHGTAEAIVFPETWARLNSLVHEDEAVLLGGRVQPPRPGGGPGPVRGGDGPAAGGAHAAPGPWA